ncbi:MAG TPA: HAMP domain-containing sensor histidine kinase [Micromonosporaceae bacterium]|jgi:signal transduction histidine kinase
MSIRTRITLVGLGIVTVVICCLSGTLFALISHGIETDRDALLAARADELLAGIAAAPADDLAPATVLAQIDPRTSVDVFTMVLDQNGVALQYTGSVDGRPLPIPAQTLHAATRDGSATAAVPIAGGATNETVRVLVRPWSRPDLGRSGYVVAAQTSRKPQQDRAGLVVLFGIAGLVTFIAAAIAVWVATGRALRPLLQLATLADDIGRSQDLTRRLPQRATPDAVGRLASSFNAMMDRLEQAYQRLAAALAAQQRFTADASHELRTPLTTIRNNAEFLLQHPQAREEDRSAALGDIAGESRRLSRLVDNLLTLARADGGVTLRREPVDLAAVAEPVCRQAAALHPQRRIDFSATPARAVVGDADLLTQLLWILVDNAVRFTERAGTPGRVWVAVTQRGSRVHLTVADNGTGIPPGSEQRIFERFYRADESRSGRGAGLGLAIAAWIVREHAGEIVAANNDHGGATFSVDLPAAPAPAGTEPEPVTAQLPGVGPAHASAVADPSAVIRPRSP